MFVASILNLNAEISVLALCHSLFVNQIKIFNTRRMAIFNYLEGRNASIDAKFSKLPNYHVARKKALQLLKIFLIKDCFDVLLN